MNKKITIILAAIFFSMISLSTISEANAINNRTLTAKQQGIVPIAAFTANGNQEKLKIALNEGLDAGLTINEIKEVLVQMYAYCGFPRSLNGINTFISVTEERQAKGIKDELGREPSPLPDNKSSIELGEEIRNKLTGAPLVRGYMVFTPVIDEFLRGHLFGDIFGRDNLNYQDREIATIAALASLDGVNAQLRSHFNVGMNTGLTESQLEDLISVIESKVGKKESDNARGVLNGFLSNRAK